MEVESGTSFSSLLEHKEMPVLMAIRANSAVILPPSAEPATLPNLL